VWDEELKLCGPSMTHERLLVLHAPGYQRAVCTWLLPSLLLLLLLVVLILLLWVQDPCRKEPCWPSFAEVLDGDLNASKHLMVNIHHDRQSCLPLGKNLISLLRLKLGEAAPCRK